MLMFNVQFRMPKEEKRFLVIVSVNVPPTFVKGLKLEFKRRLFSLQLPYNNPILCSPWLSCLCSFF